MSRDPLIRIDLRGDPWCAAVGETLRVARRLGRNFSRLEHGLQVREERLREELTKLWSSNNLAASSTRTIVNAEYLEVIGTTRTTSDLRDLAHGSNGTKSVPNGMHRTREH